MGYQFVWYAYTTLLLSDPYLTEVRWFEDQMGVELGKVLAKNILAQLGKPEDVKGHDSSVRLPVDLFDNMFSLLVTLDNWLDSLLSEGSQGVIGGLAARNGEAMVNERTERRCMF